MKNIYKSIVLAGGIIATMAGCEKWTRTEVREALVLSGLVKSEAYYESLRAYKESEHSVTFGWFGNWTGTGASQENSMMGLPDSVDFVSMWGGWAGPSKEKLEDFRRVRELKGTKALVCFLVFDIGDQITPPIPEDKEQEGMTYKEWRHEYWGWGTTLEEHVAATEKYARAILDTIAKYDYDGFDLDAEPSYAQPFQTDKELWTNGSEVMEAFVKTLATELGPKAGKGKLLVIDGEPEAMAPEFADYFDYFILQAYSCSSESNLNSRYSRQVSHWDGYLTPEQVANKLIVCENFESYAQNGGITFSRPNGTQVPSLWGMAYWQPTYDGQTFRKGGVGTYHMEYEYKVPGKEGTYPWLRQSIQIMNPRIY